jgi:adenine specific DNA methylase Mod
MATAGCKDTWMNRLIYGDNLLAMQALLAGDQQTGLPSLRGKVDLIYIDPPFDSKADYRTKISLPGNRYSAEANCNRTIRLCRYVGRGDNFLSQNDLSSARVDARIAFRTWKYLCAY